MWFKSEVIWTNRAQSSVVKVSLVGPVEGFTPRRIECPVFRFVSSETTKNRHDYGYTRKNVTKRVDLEQSTAGGIAKQYDHMARYIRSVIAVWYCQTT